MISQRRKRLRHVFFNRGIHLSFWKCLSAWHPPRLIIYQSPQKNLRCTLAQKEIYLASWYSRSCQGSVPEHHHAICKSFSILGRLAPMLQYLSTNASICTMLAISIERYIVICRPFKVRSYCTKRRAVGIIIILWAFSFVCSFPLLAMDFTFYGSVYHDYLQTNVTVCYIQQEYHSYYFFCHQAFFYVLPGLMLSLLYLKIIWTLQEFKGERFGHSPDSRRNTGPGAKSQADTSQQLIVMLSTVVLCYFVCLFPYNFVMFISLLDPELLRGISTTNYQLLLSISRIMFYVNSCSNPILYNAISGKFRNAFLRLFCPARYKSAGRDSRTLSVRGSADYDYDDRIRFDEQRNRRCTKKTIRSGSDLSCRTGLVRWEQRELCDPGVNCQRRATDGVIRRTRQNRERRTTEPIPFDASRDIRPEIEESSCVVEASLVGADMPLL